MKTIKIDWSKLPNWANYTAIDADGSLFCFEEKPTFNHDTGYWENITNGRYRHKRLSEAATYKIDGQYYKTLTERPNKRYIPSWDDAPEWANWMAQNKDGNWHWFEAEPELYDYRFLPIDFTRHQFAIRSENTDGWESSLQKKPNEVAIEFFDKLCDDTIDWSEAPEWANWSIQNPHGLWFWIENKPFINDSNEEYEIRQKGKFKFYKKTASMKDWTTTLQERPKSILIELRPRFESARVGDKAYSIKAGWGTIINIDLTSGTPLRFKPDNKSLIKKLHYYDLYGHSNNKLTPELYWDVPTITGGDIPPERMASIGGYQYPEPEREAPKYSDTFYYPVITGSHAGSGDAVWVGASTQLRILKEGNIHLCRSNALQHSKALVAAIKDMESKNNGTSNSSN